MRKTISLFALTLVGLVGATQQPAHAGVRVGIGVGIGFPGYYYPWGYPYGPYPYGYYYRPYPVYVTAPPVVVAAPAPVVVQPGSTVQAAPPLQPVPAVAPTIRASSYASTPEDSSVERNLQLLADANEKVRCDAVMELGRQKADRAADPLTATLAGDRSPTVRDAAARALGLIGDRRSLTALTYAAQADPDREVRHSAQFAVETIRSQLQKKE
jgi:HEAT repeats